MKLLGKKHASEVFVPFVHERDKMGKLIAGSPSSTGPGSSFNPTLLRMALLAKSSDHSKSNDRQPRAKAKPKKQPLRRPFIVKDTAASERSRHESEELFDALLQQSSVG